MTPFQALYGHEPTNWKDLVLKDTNVPEVRNQLENSQKTIDLLKDNLAMAQNHMRQQADQYRTKREFTVGDWVSIRLQPYKQVSLKSGGKTKFAPNLYGPYWITKKISQVAYKLQLPDNSPIHNIFHVSCLKKMLGKHQIVQTILPMFVDEGRIIWEPKAIIIPKK